MSARTPDPGTFSFSITSPDGQLIEVSGFLSELDGKAVIQIDTAADVRINVNDGAIWNTDPESGYFDRILTAAQQWHHRLLASSLHGAILATKAGNKRAPLPLQDDLVLLEAALESLDAGINSTYSPTIHLHP